MTPNHMAGATPKSTCSSGSTAENMLAVFAAELARCPAIELEFSLRLSSGMVQHTGRFACWINGTAAQDFFCMEKLLLHLEAPPPVLAAQREQQLPVRQAIAISLDDAGVEFRLYLHQRDSPTFADRYQGWRWRPGEDARQSQYVFHFMPETASGTRPLQFVSQELRPAFELLLQEPLLQQMSGFWLRYGESGEVDQLDLALPWHPASGSLPGFEHLLRKIDVPEQEFAAWRELPVRHLALSVGKKAPAITLYAPAALTGPFPKTEQQLQTCVFENSTTTQRKIEQEILRCLPSLPLETNHDLGGFYDGPVETWQAVLGKELHYHAGIFESHDVAPDDESMTYALQRAVTELYPFLPSGGSIYDLGCGWGGPLQMFTRDLHCRTLGITVSRSQFRHIAAKGLAVRWGDAETTLPPGYFDCVVLLESLSHIRNKQRLLRTLRLFTNRLVMRVNCQDAQPPATVFGGSMHMISSTMLQTMLEEAGWQIIHWRDRRREALPSVAVWHRRLQSLPVGNDQHLETLREWCARVMTFSDEWAANNPLIEVVADRL